MSENQTPKAFNPYYEWLGIPEHQLPATYYRLLGLENFESNPTAISNGADRAMAFVRTFQTGKRSAESQQLLNELAAARVCLLNANQKATYDDALRVKLDRTDTNPLPSPPIPTPPPVFDFPPSPPMVEVKPPEVPIQPLFKVSEPAVVTPPAKTKKAAKPFPLFATVGVALVVVAIGFAVVSGAKTRRVMQQAEEAYTAAMTSYETQDYTKAESRVKKAIGLYDTPKYQALLAKISEQQTRLEEERHREEQRKAKAAAALAKLKENPELFRRLGLNEDGTEARPVEDITDGEVLHLKGLTQLLKLDMAGCKQITNTNFVFLNALLRLEELNLRWTQIDKAGFVFLQNMKQLKKLTLSDTQISDKDLIHLKDLTKLQSLELLGCKTLTGQGMVHLLKLKDLTNVNLFFSTNFSDVGLEYLKELPIEWLSIWGCENITDMGLSHLKNFKHLRTLHISGNDGMSREGIMGLRTLTGLREMQSWPRNINGQWFDDLRAALPHL